ncbi:hypothetical protein N7539_002371 [Penicillium diatomitis]|uniref:NmrA-like domain-containing protein n=1 Tax=Penicillium diatomitis TaxID=2819901 RepID=A0A9W9XEP4_9EURO|nr:uncharacterized protein N7539_002371 [Penicillium diatomitis]KAJ5490804.1 hypothetical protein N7539_002371 [Penicillium diatomitis]
MTQSKTNVLIVGATGYIGGSVLAEILGSQDAQNLCVSALIRRPEQGARLEKLGVKPIEFQGLDDLETCREAASLIPTMTSGTSILGDHPYTGNPNPQKIWSDINDDIFHMEMYHPERYGQRVTDIAVVETGQALGVKTYIVVPPTIYGKGSGPFATLSQQVPNLARFARKLGVSPVIEGGQGTWNHVHISDLSRLYLQLFRAIQEQPTWLPSGPRAIFFAESGEHTWLQVSQGIAGALKRHNLLATAEVKQVSLQEAADYITGGDVNFVEITLASKKIHSARARADFARERLGWSPSHGDEEFLNHFEAELDSMLEELATA